MPFTIDINFVDKWDESKHPRGQPGNAGQFGSGGGSPYPKNTYKQHVKPMGMLENVVKNPYGMADLAAAKIKSIVAEYSHPTIAAYGNTLLKWLEAEHGLNPGDLGKVKSKTITPEQKKHFKATLAKVAPKIHMPPPPYVAPPLVTEKPNATEHPAIQQINDLLIQETNPLVAAQKIKNLKDAGGGYNTPVVQEYAEKAFAKLLKDNPGYKMGLNEVISGQTKMNVEPIPGTATTPYTQKIPGIQQIDDIITNATNPVHAAVAIKQLSGANAAPEVQEHAKAVLANLLKYNPSKEKELKQVMGIAPKPAELPMPNEASAHQKKLYEIATDPENSNVANKIDQIKSYPTVAQYPDGYTAKYANELVMALGGEQIAYKPTPTPTSSKVMLPHTTPTPTTPVAVLKPTKPSKSWQMAQARYEAAYKPYHNNSWDQAAANQCFASASKSAWHVLQKESGGKLNSAVMFYGGAGYDQINSALRDDAGVSQHDIDMAVTIDNAFSEPEAAILKDTVIIRGTKLTSTFVDKLKNGLKNNKPTRFPLEGFSSCSFSKEPPNIGAKHQYWLEIVATKGTPLLSAAGNALGEGECEVLLRHGQSYEVLEVEEDWKSPSHGTKTRIRCITV